MKMRKILSLVLALSLVLGSFSMAFAATPAPVTGLSDIAGIANEDAIQVGYDLGIVTGNPDGTFAPAKAVNRAEFAAMITRAMAIPESALAGYTTTTFKDMNGYGWANGYIAFCQSKGIMIGDGNGNAMPGRTINANEAMTMALRAIGYVNNSAELVGTWPANYVTVAQNNSLYDDTAKNLTTVDKANAAQIIYNLLTVQKVAVNADGETKYLTIKDGKEDIQANLLNTAFECTTDAEVVLTGADYDSTLINITNKIGAYGTAYRNDDKDIVAFVADSTALTGSVDGDKFKVGDVKYTIGTNTYKTTKIVNTNVTGSAVALNAKDIDVFAANADGDVTINVDLSGKTIKDIYSAVAWQATAGNQVAQADLDDLTDDELLGSDFDTNDNEDIDLNTFALVGVASLDKIAKDNIVYVYADKSDTIRKVAVGTATVSGTVTELDESDVTISGKVYAQAEFIDGSIVTPDNAPKLDDDVKLSLDAYGDYFAVDKTSGIADKFGVMTVFTSPAGVNNAQAKVYTSDDSTKTFTFEDWNKNDIDFTGTDSQIAAVATEFNSTAAAKLIGYDINKEGNIDTLDATTSKGAATVKVQSSKVLIDGNSYLDIASDVVVFTYELKDGKYTYDVAKIADVKKSEGLNDGARFQYIYNTEDKEVVAMLVNVTHTDGTSDDVYGVINTVTAIKSGSDTIQKAVGFIGGTAATKNTTDTKTIDTDKVNTIGLFEFTVNGAGEIKGADLITNAHADADVNACRVANGITVASISSDRTVLTDVDGNKFTVQSDAIVYKALMKTNNTKLDDYELAKVSNLKKNIKVWLYDTKDSDDHDGIANVVIFQEDFPTTTATTPTPEATATGLVTVRNATVGSESFTVDGVTTYFLNAKSILTNNSGIVLQIGATNVATGIDLGDKVLVTVTGDVMTVKIVATAEELANTSIATAKTAIEGATYTATQAVVTSMGTAKAQAQVLVNALSLSGTTATVVDGTFVAAIADTDATAVNNGTNGTYTFTVTIAKALGTTATSTVKTMTITATAL